MKNVLLIDGHNFLFRSFNVPFKFFSQKGTPLHVVTTFLKLIRRSLDMVDYNEEIYIAVIYDTQTITSNHVVSQEYKANRIKSFSQMEDNPFIHLPLIKKALERLEIRQFEIPHIEADDVIATFARKFKDISPNNRVYIASSDSDFYQLLDERTQIIKHLPKNKTILVNAESVYKVLGVTPSKYVYFKSLMGDKVDNISGIPNIGLIRAKRIVNNELEIDLTKYNELINRNLTLIKLDQKANLEINMETLKYKFCILKQANKVIFEQCEF